MSASAFPNNLRLAMALCAAGLCGACSSVENLIPSFASSKPVMNASGKGEDVPESEKVVRLPLSSQDLDCPTVDIQDGAASLRVGGAENASVRYQFDISQTATFVLFQTPEEGIGVPASLAGFKEGFEQLP